jgi:ABC-type oligopeptide transport system substrate-binding subunit
MLGKVGIKAKVEVWEQSVYTTKWRKRELLPAYLVAWGGAGVFDGDLLTYSLNSKSALAIFKNEALDKMLEDAQGTNDPERRKALYWKSAGADLRRGPDHQGLSAGPHLRRQQPARLDSRGSTTCCFSTDARLK